MVPSGTPTVLVGIDGSDTAVRAAQWAATEARSRGAMLRLLYVVHCDSTDRPSTEEYERDVVTGRKALAEARIEVEATAPSVTTTCEIELGDPAGVLIAASHDAVLVCIGSTGISRIAAMNCGSTALWVSARAACSVAVVQPGERPFDTAVDTCTVVPVSVFWDHNDEIVAAAAEHARAQHCPLLVVGVKDRDLGVTSVNVLSRMATKWATQYPDIRVYPMATDDHRISGFLDGRPDLRCVVVLGADDVAQMVPLLRRHHRGHNRIEERVVVITRATSKAVRPESTPTLVGKHGDL